MPDPIEQRHPDFIFQLLDGLADRRLGREHGLGGLGKATLTHDFDKGP